MCAKVNKNLFVLFGEARGTPPPLRKIYVGIQFFSRKRQSKEGDLERQRCISQECRLLFHCGGKRRQKWKVWEKAKEALSTKKVPLNGVENLVDYSLGWNLLITQETFY